MCPQSFELTISEEFDNRLLNRKELDFKVVFRGEGTPNRLEVRKKLAAMKAADEEVVFIRFMKPKFGVHEVDGLAMVYDDPKSAQTEPAHVRIRNLPKDQREEARNQIKKGKKKKK
ncbi:MAG: 30S ribosomal protein S24e [Promethearchaeota archaeon]